MLDTVAWMGSSKLAFHNAQSFSLSHFTSITWSSFMRPPSLSLPWVWWHSGLLSTNGAWVPALSCCACCLDWSLGSGRLWTSTVAVTAAKASLSTPTGFWRRPWLDKPALPFTYSFVQERKVPFSVWKKNCSPFGQASSSGPVLLYHRGLLWTGP